MVLSYLMPNVQLSCGKKTGISSAEKAQLPTATKKYQVYSQEGQSHQLGKPYPPSGFGNTLISDLNNNRARAYKSGLLFIYRRVKRILTDHHIATTLIAQYLHPQPTPASQLYPTQLAIGVIGTSPAGNTMDGACL